MKNKICPKCKEKVTYFRWSENAVRFGDYNLEDGYTVDSTESNGGEEFFCPNCDELLFTKEEDTKDFLKLTKIELAEKRL